MTPRRHADTLGRELPPRPLRRMLMGLTRVAVTVLTVITVSVATATSASAATVTDDARALRDSIVVLTQDYEKDFGGRVTAAERSELSAMGTQARKEMNALVGAIRKAERTNAPADWQTARTVHTSALATAQVRFDRAAALLQPRLSLREQVQAYADYTRTLREFERLGQRIPAGR